MPIRGFNILVSKLVIGSVVLIAAGLVLIIMGNPSLRFATGTGPSTVTTFTSFARTFTGNFTGFFPGNFTRGAGAFGGGGRVTTAALESLAGIALVAGGLILEIFTIFLRPKATLAPTPA